jgi:hypothetical protein
MKPRIARMTRIQDMVCERPPACLAAVPLCKGNHILDRPCGRPLQVARVPSLAKEGWTRHQKKCREASFVGADGVVGSATDDRSLNQPPRLRRLMRLRAILLLAQPPLLGQGGDWLVLQRSAVVNRAMVRQVCDYPYEEGTLRNPRLNFT